MPAPDPPATERVIAWRLRTPDGRDVWFGALQDGTIFHCYPNGQWTMLVSLNDPAADLVRLTALHEADGADLTGPPCEFGLDRALCDNIRNDRGWRDTAPVIAIAHDMARRAARGKP